MRITPCFQEWHKIRKTWVYRSSQGNKRHVTLFIINEGQNFLNKDVAFIDFWKTKKSFFLAFLVRLPSNCNLYHKGDKEERKTWTLSYCSLLVPNNNKIKLLNKETKQFLSMNNSISLFVSTKFLNFLS